MADYVLLLALGLCAASMFTLAGARVVELTGWNLRLPLWFLLISLSSPLAWLLLQCLILGVILPGSDVRAGLDRNGSLYLREVLLGIGLKLWVCGAVCTAALAFFRRGIEGSRVRDARARHALWLAGGALAAMIVLPIAMDRWIQVGRISSPFALFTLTCAFVTGALPLLAASFVLVRVRGAGSQTRYAEPFAALYGVVIAGCGFIWHHAVANRPGASAVIEVEVAALIGLSVAWIGIRRANRAAARTLPVAKE